VKAQGVLGRVRFVRIWANGQVVSDQYVFAFGDSWFWELPARTADSGWTRFSLGPAGLIAIVEAAIREGARRLEGGLGHYSYKVKLGASEQPVVRLRVVADRPTVRTRAVLFNALRICLLYAYQKAWRRRLASRLPRALACPQWNFWLRLDF
jgi:CelD/BcsL family acetyltransferase involved in cellulose biosynthesis